MVEDTGVLTCCVGAVVDVPSPDAQATKSVAAPARDSSMGLVRRMTLLSNHCVFESTAGNATLGNGSD